MKTSDKAKLTRYIDDNGDDSCKVEYLKFSILVADKA